MKMNAKKMISLLVGVAFLTAFACPAFAADDRLDPISGTIDYLGSLFEVTSQGAMDVFETTMAIPDNATGMRDTRRCVKRIEYKPSIVMNRGSRWVRRGSVAR